MRLFTIHGNWTGTVKPLISTIDIVQNGPYEYERGTYTLFDRSVDNQDLITFNDDGTWVFVVDESKFSVDDYPYTNIPHIYNTDGTVTSNVIVKYSDSTGIEKSLESEMWIGQELKSSIAFSSGIYPSTYQVAVGDSEVQTRITIRVYPSGGLPMRTTGEKVISYVIWEQMDSENSSVLSSGVVKEETRLSVFQTMADTEDSVKTIEHVLNIPAVATRFRVHSLLYNVGDEDLLDYALPKDDSEVYVCTAYWAKSEPKYIKRITQAHYTSLATAAAAKSPKIDAYRLAGSTGYSSGRCIAMTNSDGVGYAYSDGDIDLTEWDSSTFTKVFSCGNCGCVALKDDGSLLVMGDGTVMDKLRQGLPFTNISKIAMYSTHAAILKDDGTVVHINADSSTWYAEADTWTNIVDIVVGMYWTIGVKSDGTTVVVRSNSNHPYGYSDLAAHTVKKVYPVDEFSFAYINSKSKAYVSNGGYTGSSNWVSDIRTKVGYWPSSIEHMECKYPYAYGFSKDPNYNHVLCTNDDIQNIVWEWTDIVAVAALKYELIAVRCDGQIFTTSYTAANIGGVNKKSNRPWAWSAKEIPT